MTIHLLQSLSTGVSAQALALTKQMFYHLSLSPNPFLLLGFLFFSFALGWPGP
jgi:hypothetical protein